MQKSKGFSLVELIVVLAIMAVLTVLLVPAFIAYRNSANESADELTLQSVADAYIRYLSDDAVKADLEKQGLLTGETFEVHLTVSDDGLISFENGEIWGNGNRILFKNSVLYRKAASATSSTAQLESRDNFSKTLVYTCTAKTSTSQASCEYSIY